MQPWLVPVGGFLGAGKTTLILAAARVLQQNGLKAAAILNDQGDQLVDTAYVRAHGVSASEVTGACFCCRFSGLIDAAEELRRYSPDVIFAEPVGSCTDLSATILQPLKRDYSGSYRVAPLTVLVDPARARSCAQSNRDPNIGFLFDRQIAEADIVAFTKCDLHRDFPSLPAGNIRHLSALSGVGVAAWLDEILSGTIETGGKILDIDYAEYARSEAALGWLNWSALLTLDPALSPAQLIGPFMDNLREVILQAGVGIAHLKILDRTTSGQLKVALDSNHGEPSIEGDLTASPETQHDVRVNLRAAMGARLLESLFLEQLAQVPGIRQNERLQCFSPSPPQPEYRYSAVVA